MSTQRLDYKKVSPSAFEAMLALSKFTENTNLDKKLLNLVYLRASQLNGCAWCLNMHTNDARESGESEQRICLLPAWYEAPTTTYTETEKAALEWTEAITLVKETRVSDEVYNKVKKYFSEKDLVDLTMAIIAINGWNRLNVAFKTNIAE